MGKHDRTYEQSDKEKAASKRGKKSKAKGKAGEKATAEELQTIDMPGFEVVQRNQGKWTGKHRPEVAICSEGNYHDQHFHFECKWRKSIGWKQALLQAEADAKSFAIPVVVGKYDSDKVRDKLGRLQSDPVNAPMVFMRLSDWLPMLEVWLESRQLPPGIRIEREEA